MRGKPDPGASFLMRGRGEAERQSAGCADRGADAGDYTDGWPAGEEANDGLGAFVLGGF
jgi:hypothetical protein